MIIVELLSKKTLDYYSSMIELLELLGQVLIKTIATNLIVVFKLD